MQINNQFSSIRGKIGILMMAVTDNDGTDQYERILALRHTLHEHTSLLVWCNSRSALERFDTWMQARGETAERRQLGDRLPAKFGCLLLAPAEETGLTFYSHWVRDPFVWKWNEPEGPVLLDSRDAENEDSLWGLLHLKNLQFDGAGPVTVKRLALPVAGGNLLFDEDFVLAGAKQLRQSAARSADADPAAVLLQTLNGAGDAKPFRRVIAVGDHTEQEPPKLIHIDLYLSLTGQRRQGRYLILLGRCEQVCGSAAPDPDLARSVAGMNAYLDAVENQLTEAGFAVERNPIPVLQMRNANESYLCAYNNCLTEVVDGAQPVVWLARLSYGQANKDYYENLLTLERANIERWEQAGFEVRMVDADFHTILDDQGSLHCITNEIMRI